MPHRSQRSEKCQLSPNANLLTYKLSFCLSQSISFHPGLDVCKKQGSPRYGLIPLPVFVSTDDCPPWVTCGVQGVCIFFAALTSVAPSCIKAGRMPAFPALKRLLAITVHGYCSFGVCLLFIDAGVCQVRAAKQHSKQSTAYTLNMKLCSWNLIKSSLRCPSINQTQA